MDSVVKIIKDLWDWIAALWETFTTFISDLVVGIISTPLSWASSAIKNIPIPSALQNIDFWGWVDPQTVYLLDKFNVGTCLGIVAAGWAVRFALNLIPSWATRV